MPNAERPAGHSTAPKETLFAFLKKAVADSPDARVGSRASMKVAESAAQKLRDWARNPAAIDATFSKTFVSTIDSFYSEVKRSYKLFGQSRNQMMIAIGAAPINQEGIDPKLIPSSDEVSVLRSHVLALMGLVYTKFTAELATEEPKQVLSALSKNEMVSTYMMFKGEMPAFSSESEFKKEDPVVASQAFFEDLLSKTHRERLEELFVGIEGPEVAKLARSMPDSKLLDMAQTSCYTVIPTLSDKENEAALSKLYELHIYRDPVEEIERHLLDLVTIRKSNFLTGRLGDMTDSWVAERIKSGSDERVVEIVRDAAFFLISSSSQDAIVGSAPHGPKFARA